MDQDKDTETEQIEETKPGRNWNGWDVFLLTVPVACIVLFPLGGVDYLCGRFIPWFYSLVRVPLYLMISGCLGLCLCTNVARLLINLKKHARKKRVLIAAEILAPPVLFYLSIAACLVPVERRLYGPTYKSYTHGFGDRIKSRADIEAIRDWLRAISRDDYTGNPDALTFDELPECLQALRPKGIHTWTDDNDNAVVRLFWGSSLAGAWGVVIGMEDMEIPASDIRDYGEYKLPLEPGVYVWYWLRNAE
jgi:hypothetical protein